MTMLAAPAGTSTPGPDQQSGSLVLLTAGVLLVLSGLWSVADELDSRLQRDIADTLYFRAFSLTHLAAFAAAMLALTVIARRRWAGDGVGSRVVLVLTGVALLQAVCAQWYVAFVIPLLAAVAPEAVNAETGWLAVGLGVALTSTMLALLSLGVAALRAGRLGRPAAWLLVVAGPAFVIVPGAQLILGAALLVSRDR